MLEIEVINAPIAKERIIQLVELAVASAGISDGHVAVTFLEAAQMAALNSEFRDIDKPTDVLSFPVDGPDPASGERELGDVFICQEYAEDLDTVIVHGVLHLVGMDHEQDDGEMLALQAEIVSWLRV